MPLYLVVFSFLFLLTSCKDQDSDLSTFDPEYSSEEKTKKDTSLIHEITPKEDHGHGLPSNDHSEEKAAQFAEGTYAKLDTDDVDCNYYCLELDFSEESRLCISEDEIYINARYEKRSNDTINVFYTGPAPENRNEDLPWKEFNKDIPIAVLTPSSDADLELDWKGFRINGELAVDYAIYGKKTLEGYYNKK